MVTGGCGAVCSSSSGMKRWIHISSVRMYEIAAQYCRLRRSSEACSSATVVSSSPRRRCIGSRSTFVCVSMIDCQRLASASSSAISVVCTPIFLSCCSRRHATMPPVPNRPTTITPANVQTGDQSNIPRIPPSRFVLLPQLSGVRGAQQRTRAEGCGKSGQEDRSWERLDVPVASGYRHQDEGGERCRGEPCRDPLPPEAVPCRTSTSDPRCRYHRRPEHITEDVARVIHHDARDSPQRHQPPRGREGRADDQPLT